MLAACCTRYHARNKYLLRYFCHSLEHGRPSILSEVSNITSNFSLSNPKFWACKRLFSSSSDDNTPSQIPPLMNFPIIVWPSVFKSIRNFILTTFIIRPYLDLEFDISDFIKGSKRAVEVHIWQSRLGSPTVIRFRW